MNDLLEDYLSLHASNVPNYLNELEDYTFRNVLKPNMISGKIQGRFLSLISTLKKPNRILELGTYTGYSALCLAEGLTENGHLISIDVNEELESIHQKFIMRSPLKDKVQIKYEDATHFLENYTGSKFDLIFIDAHKKSYPKYLELCVPLLNQRGLLLTDNVIFYEKVLDDNAKDEETLALKKFNQLVLTNPFLESFIIPIRDGISIAQKKEAN